MSTLRVVGAIAALLCLSGPAAANITVEATGRIAGGSLSVCGNSLNPCPWSGIRAGEFVHMTFEMTEPGTVLTTYPTGDIRRSEFVPGTFRMTMREQPLALRLTNTFNPVINISNNAPGADGFYIFGAADVVGLIPVGSPVSTPLVYNMSFELSKSNGTLWSSTIPANIVGTYPGSSFDFAQWSLDYANNGASMFLDKFIIRPTATATGACCPGDGFCVVTSQAACPGSWTSGGLCTPGLCAPAGACCFPEGGCSLVTASVCANTAGSIYQGDNTACGAPACPPAGACCLGSSCLISIEAACTASEGTWLGQYATCSIVPQLAHYYQHTPPQPGDVLLPITDATFIPGNPGTNVPNTTVSTLTVTDPTIIQTLEVWVGMYHGRLMDVTLELTGPNGVTLPLMRRFGATNNCTTMPIGPGHSMDGNFIFQDTAPISIHTYLSSLATGELAVGGRYRPNGCDGSAVSLDAPSPAGFGGIPLAGTWTLTITDSVGGVTGNLGLLGLSVNGGNPEPCTTGVCCINSSCAIRGFAECSGMSGTWSSGAACSPTSCAPAPVNGACCSGSTCSATTQAACTGVSTLFAGANTACNTFGVNNTAPCCLADYNHVGGVTVQDIFDFLAGYFSSNAQANINGGTVTVQDIFDFLAVYFTGC